MNIEIILPDGKTVAVPWSIFINQKKFKMYLMLEANFPVKNEQYQSIIEEAFDQTMELVKANIGDKTVFTIFACDYQDALFECGLTNECNKFTAFINAILAVHQTMQ